MRWYQQSTGGHSAHRAVAVHRSRVSAVWGVQFRPLGRRDVDPGRMPPAQVRPRCRPGAEVGCWYVRPGGDRDTPRGRLTGEDTVAASCGVVFLPGLSDTQLRGRLAELAERARGSG